VSIVEGEVAAAIGALSSFGFLAVATIAGTYQKRRNRELEHIERMRRLEAGLADPPAEALWPRALVCAAIGAGVPVSAFVVTLIAYLNKSDAAGEIWFVPIIVSVVSLITGGTLSSHLLGPKAGSAPTGADQVASKPSVDEDAFDVVGRRG
jgi:hypothetical protein